MEDIHQISDLLREIGLSSYESKIYIALLDLGKSTSGEILKKAEIRTGKVYEILESLKSKGFISEITENNVKKFSPTEPVRIRDYLKKKKESINSYEHSLNGLLPSIMERINRSRESAKIEIFTGLEGYKTACYKEIARYKKGERLYVFGILPAARYSKFVRDFYHRHVQPRRLEKNVSTKKIFAEEARGEKEFVERGTQIRYLPYSAPISINTIGDLTLLEIFSKDLLMISIESKEISQSFMNQFEAMWKTASK